jgi:thiol-disulfide isomerase/thioredoxin
MRAPADTIPAPPFPPRAKWLNVASLRMDRQLGRPVLLEFWDFCRPNSIRTLPYIKAWHERYEADGLRVIGVHSPGFPPSRDPDAVRAAVDRLAISHPVLLDTELELWQEYENEGWPARYLWDTRGMLFDYHYGEGSYAETELAIQELLGVTREPLAPLRPEDDPAAELAPQTEDQPGAYSGPYEAGAVWAVLEGPGSVEVNGAEVAVEHPGAYALLDHGRHTQAVLDLRPGPGVTCHATCFTPAVV